jgi:hypothetical protein
MILSLPLLAAPLLLVACAGAPAAGGGAPPPSRSGIPATSTLLTPHGEVATPDNSPVTSQGPLRRP